LLVPNSPSARGGNLIPWPTREMWESASLGVHESGERFRLVLRSWEPTWLSCPSKVLTDPLFTEAPRRTYQAVRGDPFLRAVGLSQYRCDAQREAVRTILSAPNGSTVVINLPTGAGKSLCAHLPAMLLSEREGVSLVVVPTTALALDQERAVEGLVSHRTAYLGGQTLREREVRDGIRSRVREGSQRILFTSPESLLGSLRSAVYHAARRGLLRLLVVDEAHMVEQWGDEFRSAFQELAGLRADLRREVPQGAVPFTTVLLTATLTENALETLETLFGKPGPNIIVSAAQLRPEPSYWAVEAPSEEARTAAVLEAVRHLPRPLMLYVTQPAEADRWAGLLRASDYERFDVVTGKTANDRRAEVIQRWRGGDSDVVVATSAFGLGVDHADVRVVLHAALSENIDRFYQEVGRGGRDGRASASLVIYTQDDIARAESLNRKTIIGIERGRERWSRMFAERVSLGGERIRVPIDVRPNLIDGINMDNDQNRAWNVRTLTLMGRANLLAFDAEAPPTATVVDPVTGDRRTRESDEYDMVFAEHQRHRVVALAHHGTVIRDVWEQRVEPIRRRTSEADARAHRLMLQLLRGDRCVAETLGVAYTIRPSSGDQQREEVVVAGACGGCAYCRASGCEPYATPLPTGMPNWPVNSSTGAVLDELRGGRSAIAIFYSESLPQHQLTRILRWLVGQGVRIAVAPAPLQGIIAEALYQRGGSDQWVFSYALDTFRLMQAPALPSVIFVPPGSSLPSHFRHSFEGADPFAPTRVLITPAETVDPLVPRRLLRSTLGCRTFSLEEFSLRVGL
jgi:ATP-dependent DNA helicase RecQ